MNLEQFKLLFPQLLLTKATEYFTYFEQVFAEYEINTPRRQAAFLAQLSHESQGLQVLSENLNYSVRSLRVTFPKYFIDDVTAQQYSKNPVKIANKVYANRMGNGNETSGDGYRFRGRGFIQITGKSNYETIGKELNLELLTNPDLASKPEIAAKTAGYFWKSHGCNELADNRDMVAITRKINGGKIGLDERIKIYNRMCSILGV